MMVQYYISTKTKLIFIPMVIEIGRFAIRNIIHQHLPVDLHYTGKPE